MNYKVYLSTKIISSKLKKGEGIIVLESDDYTKEEIKSIKSKGYKVLAYLSVGTLEKERSWYLKYIKYKLKQLDNWPNEFYIDVKKTAWRNFLIDRAMKLKGKGFDGWWLDNIDIYSEYKSKAMKTALASVFLKLKQFKGYVMLNGGSEWLDDMNDQKEDLNKYIDGYTQEEVFTLIKDYDGKGKFGKQKTEDNEFYKELIKKLEEKKINCFLLEYTRDNKLKAKIKEWCKENKVDYYIAKDVNL